MKNAFYLAVLVLVGLDVGVHVSKPAFAAQGDAYRAIIGNPFGTPSPREIEQKLNDMSQQGYEYVGSTGNVLIFKK